MSQYSTAQLLVAAMIVWGLAITIAGWARFKHVGKPLDRSGALLLASGIWLAVFIVIFRGDGHTDEAAIAVLMLIALACYAVMRLSERYSPNGPHLSEEELIRKTTKGGFEHGLLLSLSLGVFIFASQFSLDKDESAQKQMQLSLDNPTGQNDESDKKDILNAAIDSSVGVSTEQIAIPTHYESIRLEDGWNISLFHYDSSSKKVNIEAVVSDTKSAASTGNPTVLKSTSNKWHKISDVQVIAHANEEVVTWIEVMLPPEHVDTLRYAAETGAISVYSL